MVYASLTPNSMHMMERTTRTEDWDYYYYYPQRRRTPSFSSTLLDSIYRSIDESKSNLDENPQLGLSTTTTPKKQSNLNYHNNNSSVEKSYNNNKKEKMIEDWMEKKQNTPSHSSKYFVNSTTSTSSESSSMFSSSETDTTHHKPKQRPVRNKVNYSEKNQKKPKRDGGGGGFARTKLRALKIYYGELNQKVMMKQKKQPISPGSRIASFLSSIFNNTAANVKKPKMCYVGAVEDVTRTSFDGHNKSKSPSSFSTRSCMTKTTSSSSSSSKGKRSVRFYPVSMILGEEDSQHSTKEVKKKKNCVNVAKENGFNIKGHQQNSCKGTNQFGFRGSYDDGDDDALSYSSSDLFELDHLIGAGISRFQEELPVYETTNLETNKAIANGLRL